MNSDGKGAEKRRGKVGRKSLVLALACSSLLGLFLLVSGCDKTPPGDTPAAEKTVPENVTARVPFEQLFDVQGTTVTPKKVIRAGATTMTPEVPFESNVMRIDNAPFSEYIGRDAEVKKRGDVTEIIRFY